ncbi:MAG: hypothetical protein ACYC0T_07355 [Ramlibacter sp.]
MDDRKWQEDGELKVATEYAPDNVRVNTICIGLVRSAQIDRMAKGGDLEAHYARLAQERVPSRRPPSARASSSRTRRAPAPTWRPRSSRPRRPTATRC